jgi:hypothetical protein
VVLDVLMEVSAVRTGMHQAGILRGWDVMVYVNPTTVKNDREGSAPRIIIHGIEIRRVQHHGDYLFSLARQGLPQSASAPAVRGNFAGQLFCQN